MRHAVQRLMAVPSSDPDIVRRSRSAVAVIGVALAITALAVPVFLVTYGPRVAWWNVAIMAGMAGALVLARRARPTAAGLVLAALLVLAGLVPLIVTGRLGTWPLYVPGAAVMVALALPRRSLPFVALGAVALIGVFVLLADNPSAREVSGWELTEMSGLYLLLLLAIGALGSSSWRVADEAADAARAHARQLQDLVQRDPLTGVFNRRLEAEALPDLVEVARTDHDPLTVAMIDLDGFKDINDDCGHATGDRALVAVASTLVDGSRRMDIVVRHGGDEFLLVMPGTHRDEAEAVCQRLQRAVASLHVQDDTGQVVPLRMTYGLGGSDEAESGGPDEAAETIVARADERMRARKPAR